MKSFVGLHALLVLIVQSSSGSGSLIQTSADFEVVIDTEGEQHPFEGVGALSAGGSSRLLWDYGEEARNKILDLLFLPNYGAALHILKVEIGGDTQSTDGAEPSHQHRRDDASMDCGRGYEVWLLKEAKKRNPSLLTYGLSWGVPGWVGNETFFSDDNIKYQVDWMKCMKSEATVEIDFLGIWNERAWGTVGYVQSLRSALDEAGFSKTQLILSDGGPLGDLPETIEKDAKFRSSFHGVGRHYPCNASWPDLRERFGKAYWSSEEASVPADWGGAGCWGRMLNQNYVRMNMTANIAWSLVWSVYSNLDCFGNGLLYAFQPWSGAFSVNLPIWTTAHTTQFVQPGWHYLRSSSGTLPHGGTHVTLTDGDGNLTVIVETLTGQCFYHDGCFHDVSPTAAQRVVLQFPSHLSLTHLLRWTSNATSQFLRARDVLVDRDGRATLDVPVDTIITLTTPGNDRGQSKAGATVLPAPNEQGHADPFPMPYEEDFESYPKAVSGSMPTYFAAQAGAWEAGGGLLRQVVQRAPGRNAWTCNSLPFAHLGDANWSDYRASVQAKVIANAVSEQHGEQQQHQVGLCVRVLRYPGFRCGDVAGYCLQLGPSGWRLTTNRGGSGSGSGSATQLAASKESSAATTAATRVRTAAAAASSASSPTLVLAGADSPALPVEHWATLELRVRGLDVTALVNGTTIASVRSTNVGRGQVALQSGWHTAHFDNLVIEPLAPPAGHRPNTQPEPQHQQQSTPFNHNKQRQQQQPQQRQQQQPPEQQHLQGVQRQSLVKAWSPFAWDWHLRSCDPAPRDLGRGLRNDFGGFVGMKIELHEAVRPVALGRWRYDGTAEPHVLSLVQETPTGNRSWSLKLNASATRSADAGVDDLGFAWAPWTWSSKTHIDPDVDIQDELGTEREPGTLAPGSYYVLSEEFGGTATDYWLDQGVQVTEQPWGKVVSAVYGANLANLQVGLPHTTFGPVNLMVQTPAGHDLLSEDVDGVSWNFPKIALNTFFA